jgi:hypothetical protein
MNPAVASPHGDRASSGTHQPTDLDTFLVRRSKLSAVGELGCRQQPLASRVWGKKLHIAGYRKTPVKATADTKFDFAALSKVSTVYTSRRKIELIL